MVNKCQKVVETSSKETLNVNINLLHSSQGKAINC